MSRTPVLTHLVVNVIRNVMMIIVTIVIRSVPPTLVYVVAPTAMNRTLVQTRHAVNAM